MKTRIMSAQSYTDLFVVKHDIYLTRLIVPKKITDKVQRIDTDISQQGLDKKSALTRGVFGSLLGTIPAIFGIATAKQNVWGKFTIYLKDFEVKKIYVETTDKVLIKQLYRMSEEVPVNAIKKLSRKSRRKNGWSGKNYQRF